MPCPNFQPIFFRILAPTESFGGGAKDSARAEAIGLGWVVSLHHESAKMRAYTLLVFRYATLSPLLCRGATEIHLLMFVDEFLALAQLREVFLVHEVFGSRSLLLRAVVP